MATEFGGVIDTGIAPAVVGAVMVAAVLVVTGDSSLVDTAGWLPGAFVAWTGSWLSLVTGAWLLVAVSTEGVAGDSCLLQPAASRSAVPAANPNIECLYVMIILK